MALWLALNLATMACRVWPRLPPRPYQKLSWTGEAEAEKEAESATAEARHHHFLPMVPP
jgi:hypothetical protein